MVLGCLFFGGVWGGDLCVCERETEVFVDFYEFVWFECGYRVIVDYWGVVVVRDIVRLSECFNWFLCSDFRFWC